MAPVRKQDLVYFAGGRCLQRYGVWRKRTAPWEEVVETHERTDAAVSKGRDGVLRSAAANVPRPHWVTDHNGILVPSYLLEGAGTNELTRAKALDHADWTKSDASVTADQATGPDGETSLDELVEAVSASGQSHQVNQGVTGLTANANYALSAWANANDRNWIKLRIASADDATNDVEAWFNLSDGTVGTSNARNSASVVRAYVEDSTDAADGLFRVVLVGSTGDGSTGATAHLYMSDADGSSTYAGDGSSSLYAGYVQLEDDVNFASSFMDSVASAQSRDADLLQESDVGFTPKDIVDNGGLTFLSEIVNLGTFQVGSRVWQIGGPNPGDNPRLLLYRAGGDDKVRFAIDDGTTAVESTTGTGLVSISDHALIRGTVFLDGSDWKIQVHVSVNGGAEVSAAAATIGTSLPDAWSADTLTINSAPDETSHGTAAHIAHRFALGEHTLAEMEAAL